MAAASRLLFLFSGLLLLAAATHAQRPLPGVVWQEPASLEQAQADLAQMHAMGIRAVRTGLIQTEPLLEQADSLGLYFFQEAPVAFRPARLLRLVQNNTAALLETALERAQRHPSARFFGLARRVDTSDPASCGYFEDILRQVRPLAPAGTQFYYTTTFSESDACAATVDFVLLDVQGATDPEKRLNRWVAHRADSTSVPVGIAALGTWVRSDSLEGVWVPGSPEMQARYLETHLPVLLRRSLVAVFVHRWRDVSRENLSVGFNDPYLRDYGLHTQNSEARPAQQVVAAHYGGPPRAFAFATGTRPDAPLPWIVLLGWGLILGLGILYTATPRFRHMVPRYFVAHMYHREAVREGRDALPMANVAILVCAAFAFSILGTVILRAVQETAAFQWLWQSLPTTPRSLLSGLITRPWLLLVFLGCFYALGSLIWAALLSAFSRRGARLFPWQALMLILWPRWTLFLVMIGAMVVATMEPNTMLHAAPWLLLAWVATTTYAFFRTLADFLAVTNLPLIWGILAALGKPAVLFGGIFLVVLMRYWPEVIFFWHLATRT